MSDTWTITALKYAERTARKRYESFIFEDDHASDQPMDYYVWLLQNGPRSILVDTGYDAAEGANRDRPIEQDPADMLAEMGVDPGLIDTVILTHLHYDHAGTLKRYPKARLWVQEREMAYATGPCMCHDHLRFVYTGDHICDMVRALFEGRVTFTRGSAEVAPGVETHLIGGHSRGLQAVRVRTERGWVVLASDASHYYENYQTGRPFPIVVDLQDMLDGFDTLRRLASGPDHIIPGHDPLVRARYPKRDAGSDKRVLLHLPPEG